jgi:lipopolysaccharide biosynthesis glycosyltransferase
MECNGMKRYYCTYFDHRYLDRGKALYHSMLAHCGDFNLFVLCLSMECYEELQKLNLHRINLIYLGELEKWDSELLQTKITRSLVEYYFTCTPSLPLYILNHFPKVDLITYLDSDLFFFSDPEPLFDEMQENSIAIIGHKFPSHCRHLEDTGKYNVGWISFRGDSNGISCLSWYRERCIEWCYDRIENGKFGDQKYLDYFPEKFLNVIELQHKGANLAPWNITNYSLTQTGPYLKVDDQLLIFYHFQGVKHVIGPLYNSGLSIYEVEMNKIMRNKLYNPYIQCLYENRTKIKYGINDNVRYGGIYYTCLRDMVRFLNYAVKNHGFSITSLTSNPYVICWGNPMDGR